MTKTLPQTLVVEDNPLAHNALVEVLTHHGYSVMAAENGQQAISYLRNNPPPDIIILDMMLPVMDGWQFLNEFKKMNVQPRPWIVLATGAPAISREWAADHGCGGFVRKPVEKEDLLSEIQRCLSRTSEVRIPEERERA